MVGPQVLRQMSDIYRKLRGTLRYLLGNLHDWRVCLSFSVCGIQASMIKASSVNEIPQVCSMESFARGIIFYVTVYYVYVYSRYNLVNTSYLTLR